MGELILLNCFFLLLAACEIGSPRWKKSKPLDTVELAFCCSMKSTDQAQEDTTKAKTNGGRWLLFLPLLRTHTRSFVFGRRALFNRMSTLRYSKSGFNFFHRGPPKWMEAHQHTHTMETHQHTDKHIHAIPTCSRPRRKRTFQDTK